MNPSSASCVCNPQSHLQFQGNPTHLCTQGSPGTKQVNDCKCISKSTKSKRNTRFCCDLKPRFHLLKSNLTLSWPAFGEERFVSSELINHPLTVQKDVLCHTDTPPGQGESFSPTSSHQLPKPVDSTPPQTNTRNASQGLRRNE